MGKSDLAKKYYNHCVNELSDNDPLLLIAYKDLADIVSQQRDYEESVRWYQKLEDAKKGEIIISMYYGSLKATLSNFRHNSYVFDKVLGF
jgi:tetratricopeptide (TPR) repeat protein